MISDKEFHCRLSVENILYVAQNALTYNKTYSLTSMQKPSKKIVLARHSIAIPPVVSELVLTFPNPVFNPSTYRLHHFGMLAAQLTLFVN